MICMPFKFSLDLCVSGYIKLSHHLSGIRRKRHHFCVTIQAPCLLAAGLVSSDVCCVLQLRLSSEGNLAAAAQPLDLSEMTVPLGAVDHLRNGVKITVNLIWWS